MSLAAPIDSASPSLPAAPGRGRLVNRRTVLGAAVAGGAVVAAVRLLGLDGALERAAGLTDSGSGWESPLGSESARVAQLLRRTTFGAAAAELEQARSDGFDKTVDRLLETKPEAPPTYQLTNGYGINAASLQQWWVDHILQTSTPFAEKMTLFWHNHFTSDYRKVGAQTPYIYWQNLTWRDMALSSLPDMLRRVTADPAMLRYLDLGVSTGANPNENYSRELMELFTMGPGNYTEDDVRAAAKGLAGWQEPTPTSTVTVAVDAKNGVTRRYPLFATQMSGHLNSRRTYKGTARFLGRTLTWDTNGVLGQILAQPAVAPFIAQKVAQHFLATRPDPATVKDLAAGFKSSGYDVKTLLRNLFRSPQFSADSSYRALVKSPVEFMVHTLKALGATNLSRLAVAAAHDQGQVLFDPPDVGGWPNNEAWISSNTVVARVNFVSAALRQTSSLPAGAGAPAHVDGVLGPATAQLLMEARTDQERWFVALASPEFQLK
ncbi:MAG: DUF1800 domain-containing protein [Candidatus Dormibacteraeota bacterium]|nr:DUF1800 domain-containing protein [Candidatus Dormibacteraeota bacterium]